MSGPFATAEELAEYTGLTLPQDLARWQSVLEGASALIRSFTGQTLSLVSADVVILPPIERTVLILPERPVVSIASVVENGVTLSSSTDYWFASGSGLLYRGSMVLPGSDWLYGATVTYTHGYAETTDEYKMLRQLCMDVAAATITQNQNDASLSLGGIAMETVGFAPRVFLTDGDKMKLADYGMVLVG